MTSEDDQSMVENTWGKNMGQFSHLLHLEICKKTKQLEKL